MTWTPDDYEWRERLRCCRGDGEDCAPRELRIRVLHLIRQRAILEHRSSRVLVRLQTIQPDTEDPYFPQTQTPPDDAKEQQ